MWTQEAYRVASGARLLCVPMGLGGGGESPASSPDGVGGTPSSPKRGVPHPVLMGEGYPYPVLMEGGVPPSSPDRGSHLVLMEVPQVDKMGLPPVRIGWGTISMSEPDGAPPGWQMGVLSRHQNLTHKLKILPSPILRMQAIKIEKSRCCSGGASLGSSYAVARTLGSVFSKSSLQ